MEDKKIVITGANGQLGKALSQTFPNATKLTSQDLDISNAQQVESFDWSSYTTVVNAAAYTNVDSAETNEGRIAAWKANAVGPSLLAKAATDNNLTLVHISSDYVFDGSLEIHDESEPFSPLGVYGQTKAAGDIAVAETNNHFLIRTSWVIGDGGNFVRSMLGLADKGVSPSVVADQYGRLGFCSEIARFIKHLLDQRPAYGTYNLSNDGNIVSWADIARAVYELSGHSELVVSDTTAEAYFAGKLAAARPTHSALNLDKAKSIGFLPNDWLVDLKNYIDKEKN